LLFTLATCHLREFATLRLCEFVNCICLLSVERTRTRTWSFLFAYCHNSTYGVGIICMHPSELPPPPSPTLFHSVIGGDSLELSFLFSWCFNLIVICTCKYECICIYINIYIYVSKYMCNWNYINLISNLYRNKFNLIFIYFIFIFMFISNCICICNYLQLQYYK